MVTKKRSGRKAAPRRRVYAARRAAPRRRAKSGVTMIPGAMATVGLVAANADNIKQLYKAITNNGQETNKAFQRIMSGNEWVVRRAKCFVTPYSLAMSAAFTAGGYVAGEVLKKYAPGVIKRPLGKIAKKIPKVI